MMLALPDVQRVGNTIAIKISSARVADTRVIRVALVRIIFVWKLMISSVVVRNLYSIVTYKRVDSCPNDQRSLHAKSYNQY